MDIYTKSKIKKIALLKLNAEKLKKPSKNAALKVGIGVSLHFDDKKTDLGYEVTYNLNIFCEENEEKKLCKLDYKIMIVYEIPGEPKEIDQKFGDESALFIREIYHMTRDYLNDILLKMKVRLQLPVSVPDDFILNMTEAKIEK